MFSSIKKTHQEVMRKQCKLELIEENLVVPFERLKETTAFPDTLEVTENLQYRNRGLLHVPDTVFLFVKEMEGVRIQVLNVARINMVDDKSVVVDLALTTILDDQDLGQKWLLGFPGLPQSKV